MINKNMKEIIFERATKHIEDIYGIQKCQEKIVQLLSQDEKQTIEYLNQCTEEELSFISEVFESISSNLKSEKFIECIKKLSEKYENLDMEYDIMCAEASLDIETNNKKIV